MSQSEVYLLIFFAITTSILLVMYWYSANTYLLLTLLLLCSLLAWQKYWKSNTSWSVFEKYNNHTNDKCGSSTHVVANLVIYTSAKYYQDQSKFEQAIQVVCLSELVVCL